jgi:UDP-N-acetylmuramoylalanine--D-glutamate ligase
MKREEMGRMPEAWVLELSSFQLQSTDSLAASAATVLNLSEDHLDRHADMAEYAHAKARIFFGGGAQVLNREDSYSRAMQIPGRLVFSFALDPAPTSEDFGLLKLKNEFWLAQGTTPLMPVAEMKLAGLHNAANALAALALTHAIGLPLAPLLDTLRRFGGLPHRVERAGEVDGVLFYDDSKGTNVGSTVAALEGFARQFAGSEQKVVLIAGGEGKGQNFAPLQNAIARSARAVVLIGRDAPLIRAAIADCGVAIIDAVDMQDAVRKARDLSETGDVVLLSPACASFDMFKNYGHRGDMFCAAVQALGVAHATH